MSHLTAMKTCIKSLDVVEATCRALGIVLVLNPERVKTYSRRSEKIAAAMYPPTFRGSKTADRREQYGIYLRESTDGTYNVVADWSYGIDYSSDWTDNRFLEKTFGTMASTKAGNQYDYPRTMLPFLREYGRQFGLSDATYHGRTVEEKTDKEGNLVMLMTNGDLEPGEAVQLTVNKDGTCTIAAIGFSGDRCKLATETLEAALGTIVDEAFTADYYHQQDEQGLSHSGGE